MAAMLVFWGTKLAGKQLVIYVRNGFRGDRLRWIYRLPMLTADAIVTISQALSAFVKEHGGPNIAKKVTQIYNSVDLADVDAFKRQHSRTLCRAQLQIPVDVIAVGVVAFIEPRKRQREFLRNVVHQLRVRRNVHFYFVGGVKNPGYFAECENFVKSAGLQNVMFAGYRQDMFCWYRALDIVCLPSDLEGVPRSLIEAGAFELPVVAFNIAGCREAVLNEQTGYLVASFEEMAARLVELIEQPALRAKFGACGYEHVRQEFDVVRNTKRLEALYTSLK